MKTTSKLARIYDTKRGMVALVEITESRTFAERLLDRCNSRTLTVVDGTLTEVELNKLAAALRAEVSTSCEVAGVNGLLMVVE